MSERVQLVDIDGNFVRVVERDNRDKYPDLHLLIAELVLFLPDGRIIFHERKSKNENGKLDHVCGAVRAEETPLQAVLREAQEEVEVFSLLPEDITEVSRDINEYNRYRVLFRGVIESIPILSPNNQDAARVGAATLEELNQMQSEEQPFVKGYFVSLQIASYQK
jgi:ADP-ribose pyrophosphatase YjhB (NUDIX family)